MASRGMAASSLAKHALATLMVRRVPGVADLPAGRAQHRAEARPWPIETWQVQLAVARPRGDAWVNCRPVRETSGGAGGSTTATLAQGWPPAFAGESEREVHRQAVVLDLGEELAVGGRPIVVVPEHAP